MCIICDGKRDMRLLDAALKIMNEVDFNRAMNVAMAEVLSEHVVEDILRPALINGGVLPVDDVTAYVDDEDEESRAVVTMVMILNAASDFWNILGEILEDRGQVGVPGTDSGLPEAFEDLIEGLFPEGDDDLHESEHDGEG